MKEVRQLNSVVLPAPLGPMTLWIAPCGGTRRLTFSDREQAAEALGVILVRLEQDVAHTASRLLIAFGPQPLRLQPNTAMTTSP